MSKGSGDHPGHWTPPGFSPPARRRQRNWSWSLKGAGGSRFPSGGMVSFSNSFSHIYIYIHRLSDIVRHRSFVWTYHWNFIKCPSMANFKVRKVQNASAQGWNVVCGPQANLKTWWLDETRWHKIASISKSLSQHLAASIGLRDSAAFSHPRFHLHG